jgi:hypothetical protein
MAQMRSPGELNTAIAHLSDVCLGCLIDRDETSFRQATGILAALRWARGDVDDSPAGFEALLADLDYIDGIHRKERIH